MNHEPATPRRAGLGVFITVLIAVAAVVLIYHSYADVRSPVQTAENANEPIAHRAPSKPNEPLPSLGNAP